MRVLFKTHLRKRSVLFKMLLRKKNRFFYNALNRLMRLLEI